MEFVHSNVAFEGVSRMPPFIAPAQTRLPMPYAASDTTDPMSIWEEVERPAGAANPEQPKASDKPQRPEDRDTKKSK